MLKKIVEDMQLIQLKWYGWFQVIDYIKILNQILIWSPQSEVTRRPRKRWGEGIYQIRD